MAVKSSKKKKKNKKIKKQQKKKSITNNQINKEIKIENEVFNEFQKDNIFKNEVIKENNIDKEIIKNNKFNPIYLIIIYIFLLSTFLLLPNIKLLGSENITISYNEKYQESGYISKFYDKIQIDNNIKEGIVGKYNINYYYNFLGIKVNKERKVNIVDNIKPKINTDNSYLNLCPNQEIPTINYSAIDEYDGDITNLVEKTINDSEIILKVKDTSGNVTSSQIIINREDKEKPIISLKGSSYMYLNYGKKYQEPGFIVSDNCSNNLNEKVKITGSVGANVGTYNILYEVIDDSGNKSSVTRKVVVGNPIIDNGIIHTGSIYLTFDDGPNEGTTNKILDILKEEGIKATFFVTSNGPDYLIKRMHDEGHTVALHTATHNYANIYSSVDNYFNDLNQISARVKRITGVDSKIIRFPGGSSNTISKNYKTGIMTELTNLVLHNGYRYYDWNVDCMDASTARNSEDVYYNVVSNLSIYRENMVLMHDIKSITVGALRNIIKFGKESGYQFKKIEMNTHMVRHGVNN